MSFDAKEFMDEQMMDDHPHKTPGREEGIYRPEGSPGDPIFNVATQKFMKPSHSGFEEDRGQLMPLEGAEQEQPHESSVLRDPFDEGQRQRLENPPVVSSLCRG